MRLTGGFRRFAPSTHRLQAWIPTGIIAAASDCAAFIHFILQAIASALTEVEANNNLNGSEISSEISSEKILALIARDERISAKAMAEQLGISARAVEKQLAKLKATGSLQRVGSAKGGSWLLFNSA